MFFRPKNFPDKWNSRIVLLPHDKLSRATLIRITPSWLQPNHITVFRLFLTPIVLYLLAAGNFAWGLPLFVFTALTDAFDGSLARVRRQISEWGILFDPVVDKIFIGSVLFIIVFKYVNFNLCIALLGAEALLILFGWLRVRRGLIEPANFWGKIKMVFEVVGLSLILIALWFQVDILTDISMSTLGLALIFAIISVYTRIK